MNQESTSNSGAHGGASQKKNNLQDTEAHTICKAYDIMTMLNDLAWHSMEIRRLSSELKNRGVSEEVIEAFMENYREFLQTHCCNVVGLKE